ncbi:MAG: helix-turn-helix domain-containing protein [Rhodocyclaceae bacterium]
MRSMQSSSGRATWPAAPRASHGLRAGQCFTPDARLLQFADNFQLVSRDAAGALPRILPGSGALLCIPLGGTLQLHNLHSGTRSQFTTPFVICNRHTVLDLACDGALELIIVAFRPGRLRYLVPASFSELQDRFTCAAGLWGNARCSTLQERLALCRDNGMRMALVGEFLETCLPAQCDARLDRLHDLLYLAPETRITDLATQGGWSLRHFERLFAQAYGVSPKYFARVARLQQVARNMALGLAPNVAAAVMDAGFYDQPHFIHELQSLASLRPVELRTGPLRAAALLQPASHSRLSQVAAPERGHLTAEKNGEGFPAPSS